MSEPQRDPRIQEAIDAIGPPDKDDWIIDPTGHAEHYQESAPALAALLRMEHLQATAAQYSEADDDANLTQAEFKNPVSRAGLFVFLTACVGALVTVLGVLGDSPDGGAADAESIDLSLVFYGLGIAGLITSSLAGMWLSRVRQAESLSGWMSSRAEAEARRVEYFDRVRETGPRDDPDLELLKLEYLHRYLLQSQEKFFAFRGVQHRGSGTKAFKRATLATTVAVILTSAAGFLAPVDKRWAGLAGLGVVATAYSSMATSREAVDQDLRNARRYRVTLSQIRDLRKDIEAVREATLHGRNEAHDDLGAALRSVLTKEHAEWLEGAEERSAAVEQLEVRLQELKSEGIGSERVEEETPPPTPPPPDPNE